MKSEEEYQKLGLFMYRGSMLCIQVILLVFLIRVLDGIYLRKGDRCESARVGDVAVWQYDQNMREVCTHHDYSAYWKKREQ